MRKLIGFLAIAFGLSAAQDAEAAFKVRISDGTVAGTRYIEDGVFNGGLGDLLPGTSGSILAAYSGGGWTLTITSALSDPILPANPYLAQLSISVDGSHVAGASVLTVDVTDTDFSVQAVDGKLAMRSYLTGSVAAGTGSFSYQSWVNYASGAGAGNEEFGGVPPVAGDGINPAPTGSVFSVGPHGVGDITGLFSTPTNPNPLSISARMTLTPNNSSAGAAYSTDGGTQVVSPAPAGLLLAMSGLPLLGLTFWRRRKLRVVAN